MTAEQKNTNAETLRLAIVQHRTERPDPEENTARALAFMREAKAGGADLVLFPECFLTSYAPPQVCRSLPPMEALLKEPAFRAWCENALRPDDRYFSAVRAAARELHIGAVITAFSKGAQRPQNSAFVVGRDGDILLHYAKVHTCDFDWEQYLEGGNAFHVCQFDGVCLGVMICYDREHPESARELMLQGAEIILVPNDCDAMAPRLQELSVHAMQNMTYVAMANPPGPAAGNSCAYSPIVWDGDGRCVDNTLALADSLFDGILYVDLDIGKLRAYRAEEFLGKNRKPAAYRHLV